MSSRLQTQSGVDHTSSTRRGHRGHSNHVDLDDENHDSSRRHLQAVEQNAKRHEKRRRSSWMQFGGRTEPLVLLTTVTKSHRPGSYRRQHNFDAPKNGETQSRHPAQDLGLSKSSTTSSKRKPQKKTPTSSLLSLFFGPVKAHPAKPVKTIKKVTCVSCLSDEIPAFKAAKLSCSHHMCYSCLRRLFTLSMTDPQQHMPPRCCTQDHIPSKYVELLFDREFRIKWTSKYAEYTTKNRYYCPSQRCGKWIKPSNVIKDHTGKPKYGRCSRCRTRVCCLCRGRWHGSRGECPKDENVQKLEAMAKENGWQRCYNCSSIVELKDGCNHMTCRCKAQFCMRCAAKWKTCDCPWFNHNTVFDHEEAVEFGDAAVWYTDSDEEEDADVDDWMIRVLGEPTYRRQEDFAQQYILQQVIRYREEFHERLMRGVPLHPGSEQARQIGLAARGLRL